MQEYKISELTGDRITLGELMDTLSLLGFEVFQKRRTDYVKGATKHPLLADGEEIDAKKATEELITIAAEYGRTISAVVKLLVNGKESQQLEPAQEIEFESSNLGSTLTEDQRYVLQQSLEEQTEFADAVAPMLLAHQIEELEKGKIRALKKSEVREALTRLRKSRSPLAKLGKLRSDGVMVMGNIKELCGMTVDVSAEEMRDLLPMARSLPSAHPDQNGNGSKPKTPLPAGLLRSESESKN